MLDGVIRSRPYRLHLHLLYLLQRPETETVSRKVAHRNHRAYYGRAMVVLETAILVYVKVGQVGLSLCRIRGNG